MARPAQAKILKQRKTLRIAMESREESFSSLARKVGHDISVVSKAINHGKFPRVVSKLKEHLNA